MNRLRLVRDLAASGHASANDFALLTDRVLRGYGTPDDDEEANLVAQLKQAVALNDDPVVTRPGEGQDARRRSPRDSKVAFDIGGRHLVLARRGRGKPTVVLETGLGAESDEWSTVWQSVASSTQVIRYDRACRGASDPAPRPRSGSDMVDDLHALLRAARIAGPYIVVGHSFGGALARLFAHRHACEVAGLVLVDAMHEDQFDVFGPLFPSPDPDEAPALREVRAFWTTGWRAPQSTREGIDFIATCAQLRAIESLGDVPIHVLSAGTFLNQPAIPVHRRATLQQRWDEMQRCFLRLSTNSRHTSVHSSGHFMQRECPGLVVDAIRDVVMRARRVPSGH